MGTQTKEQDYMREMRQMVIDHKLAKAIETMDRAIAKTEEMKKKLRYFVLEE